MARHVPVNPGEHGDLKVRTARTAALGDAVMFAPVFPHEFRKVQAHYPIVFVNDADLGQVRPVALYGMEEGQNLFLTPSGWNAPYIPLATRMKPFLIGRSTAGLQVHLDVEDARVNTYEGEALFDADGGQTAFLSEIAGVLREVHEGEQSLAQFSALLNEFALIEPFTLDVTLNDGTMGRLAGYSTIAEEALQGLNAEALGRLNAAGILQPIFMAVASMSQLLGLIDRRNARIGEAV